MLFIQVRVIIIWKKLDNLKKKEDEKEKKMNEQANERER